MPVLPSGQVVGITSERARYHATRQQIRVTRDTPRHELYQLIDILYIEDTVENSHRKQRQIFTGHTVSDQKWLMKWRQDDRKSFLKWIDEGGATRELEAARNKVIYDTLPHAIETLPYPDQLYSPLQRRIAAMPMTESSPEQWRKTILNMRHCGIREDEMQWSGVLTFLDQAMATGRVKITREELLSRIDFSDIRLELTHELNLDDICQLPFEDRAAIIPFSHIDHSDIALSDGDVLIQRQVDSLLGYSIAYIRSPKTPLACLPRWITLDPYNKALTNTTGETAVFKHPREAMKAANQHAYAHYGLKSPLRYSNTYEYMSLHGGHDYREWLVTLPDYRHSHFTSHFTERNLLLHFRTKSRHSKDGRRLLFIEEIQSDWHQRAGRGQNRLPVQTPPAPFKKEWGLLALKLLLMHAVKKKYDGLAWTPAATLQMRFQCDLLPLKRLYEKEIPELLLQLSKEFDGQIDTTTIDTKEPWISPRRDGHYWFVKDSSGKFVTRKRFTKQEAIEVCERHSKQVSLDVPVFYPSKSMRETIKADGLPLFGSMTKDTVTVPLCGTDNFKGCDSVTRQLCMYGELCN